MTARRSRSRSAAYAALALGLAGSLALTGCNSHSSKKSKKSSFSSSKTSKTSKTKKRRIIGGSAAAAGAAGTASRRVPDCYPSTYKVTFSQQTGPKSHVAVKFKNSTSHDCKLYNAPLLRFNNAKSPLPLLQGTPGHFDGTRITVPAHGYAYAVIPTNTAATKGTEQKSVTIDFMGISASSVTHGPVTVNFAEKRLHVSVGKSKVTNWSSSLHGAQLAGGVGN
ncbi:Protein of unknown function [Streptomyces sp. 2224.1]|uniref:DUF4232 domain-containing protein n=1 Tax=unclassified Streptomyces TaxID=2593676 RepID=UPI0008820ECF|nr:MULTISPECIES: DUF4232 domain-containing protein [unclassified Streptomyces]PBC83572.1 uncharacterized protein DUF4232 [Streptomyces sp. 2321.6]SDR41071.1 Protein of unknown function [Streptomyces sp. KS_16]SEC02048.1 Protein of unknown function [Streptomyces sp. 2224.1]SED00986.1 Protein of unknown function [Streptomyces sp. 2133.1]SEE74562.1 Protein of unknown function [Streptomyces sp. 2112.3]